VNPDRYPGGKLAYPSGAELRSHSEVAELIAAEIGSPVEFTPISASQWQRDLEALAATSDVVNQHMAQHISSVGAQLFGRAAAAIAPDPGKLEEVLGRPPLSLAEFIRQHRGEFVRYPG
jgi:hypothetical protein